MAITHFEGIMTALVTPLTCENTVDVPKLEKLIDFQLANGVKGLLILGGTGEYSALTMEAREQAVRETVRYTAGRVPVVAGVLEPGLGEAIKFSRLCKAAGADAILLLAPYYVHPTQDGIVDFYRAVDAAVDMPMFVYNIPYRTYVNVLPETVERMCEEMPNIIGMKECSPNFGQAVELIHRVGDRISVLSGEEFLMSGEILMGAKGAVMASANLIPDVWVKLYELAAARKADELSALLKQYYPLIKLLFKEVNPGPLKYAMKLKGLDMGCLSIPLREPSDTLKAELKAEMERIGLL
ncbi:MAG: 4-hydroxy-tetrahydrodipicolinate synthase [Oscillospiraceae bacterium]